MRRPFLPICASWLLLACSPSSAPPPPATPVESISLMDSESAPVAAPVDIVRDEWGIPHIYGASLPDVAYAEGWVMAHDRFVQMDFLRHNADGTLAELAGKVFPSYLDSDIEMRLHHLRDSAQAAYDAFAASTDPDDQLLVASLQAFAAGASAWLAELQADPSLLPKDVAAIYKPQNAKPWTAVDSLLLLEFQFFFFGFSADGEIATTQEEAQAATVFDAAKDPLFAARKGFGSDIHILGPIDPTYTIAGWTGLNGDTTTALREPGNELRIDALRQVRRGLAQAGFDRAHFASNNWVVGPQLSKSGHVMVCNDTHVPLYNPPIWYLIHLVVSDPERPMNAMGVNFPGLPGIALGMNQHVAWAATTSQIDQTDVYAESLVPCPSGKCALRNGMQIPLKKRTETFGVGLFGAIDHTVQVTLYEVPGHGPVLPRIAMDHTVQPLGASELSVHFTGYDQTDLFARVAVAFGRSQSAADFFAAIDKSDTIAAFNWVAGDDSGHFGWSERLRVPRRQKGFAPFKILPGDGRAEWQGDLDPRYIPHAYDPAAGFIATANNDPVGATDDDDPFFDEPVVDGLPLYLGWEYDAGARVGRIHKRIENAARAEKLTIDDMQSIQADAVSEVGQLLAPTLIDAAQALGQELAAPGTHPELSAIAQKASDKAKSIVPAVAPLLLGWTFDTPAAAPEEQPSAQQIADSEAQVVFELWMRHFLHGALDDELGKIGLTASSVGHLKLLIRMCTHPERLKTGIDPQTGDPILFDDLTTPGHEGKRQIAAAALLAALDQGVTLLKSGDLSSWRWGRLHTLTLPFLANVSSLQIPPASDPQYPNGFPRHGAYGTPDIGGYFFDLKTFTVDTGDGPGIRFVAEMDPAGPKARNVLPGGEIFDPGSPHYRDQLELWRKNLSFDLAFANGDVIASATREVQKNNLGRVRFSPQ